MRSLSLINTIFGVFFSALCIYLYFELQYSFDNGSRHGFPLIENNKSIAACNYLIFGLFSIFVYLLIKLLFNYRYGLSAVLLLAVPAGLFGLAVKYTNATSSDNIYPSTINIQWKDWVVELNCEPFVYKDTLRWKFDWLCASAIILSFLFFIVMTYAKKPPKSAIAIKHKPD